MANPSGPIIDMTPDGSFVMPVSTSPSFGRIIARLLTFGALLGVAAVAFWAALFVIPMLILLGAAGYAAARMFGVAPVSRFVVRRG